LENDDNDVEDDFYANEDDQPTEVKKKEGADTDGEQGGDIFDKLVKSINAA
jgi:hypothetical protein